MSELKCCPFCGAKLELVREHYWCHPTDEKCILRHLCFEVDDLEGVELWNTRKPMERIVEYLEEYGKTSIRKTADLLMCVLKL